jgi:uncharacterized protein (DUF362 family)
MPTVAISHTNEKHRSPERVLALVEDALKYLGGMESFVKPGQTVLIKPNQAAPHTAMEGSSTDPLVVGALIHLARAAGAAKVQIAASSDGQLNAAECMRVTGMAATARREGAEILNLEGDSVPTREVDLPEGRVLHKVRIPVPLIEAGVVIAVPKARNDYTDVISGAMQLWTGVGSQEWRARPYSDKELIERFTDIMTVLRPDLCVTDALICGEGDGPEATMPRWCGCILASTDPVATDVTIARLMGRNWKRLRFAEAGEERGLGRREPITWAGIPLERIAFHAWPSREGFDYLPVNVLVGGGVTLAGTVGHVKSALDTLLRSGALERAICDKGTPTIMLGEVEDPEFERRLQEGPYVVFDDAARREYKHHPRVSFVPGHPVLESALPQLRKALSL